MNNDPTIFHWSSIIPHHQGTINTLMRTHKQNSHLGIKIKQQLSWTKTTKKLAPKQIKTPCIIVFPMSKTKTVHSTSYPTNHLTVVMNTSHPIFISSLCISISYLSISLCYRLAKINHILGIMLKLNQSLRTHLNFPSEALKEKRNDPTFFPKHQIMSHAIIIFSTQNSELIALANSKTP